MHIYDWIILLGTLGFIVGYGSWKTKQSKSESDFIKGGNESKWWTIGLSVMATQASAITFLSTPGQAFHSGMGFVQFYFGLPIAMVVICLVFIPIYHRLKVYTAYEFLEGRFDLKTRSLTAILFLIQRGLAAGITIFAPAIILSVVLGWPLLYLIVGIGGLVIVYTVSGGTKAVSITQKQQMAVIFFGMFVAFFIIVYSLPEGITFSNALSIANASGKMEILDFSFDWNNRYTFWSGIIGGSFLALSYFGTDQSQVQRYLSGKSVKEMRWGLLFNGLLKVPMQFFILLVGVMVFVFYQFNETPLNFNPRSTEIVYKSKQADAYRAIEKEQHDLFQVKKEIIESFAQHPTPALQQEIAEVTAQEATLRKEAGKLLDLTAKQEKIKLESNDKDYVFIHFILTNLPRGLIGLLLAVILSAAMSSTASELNALGTTTTMDLYKRNITGKRGEKHFVMASKYFTLGWGILAILLASVASLVENLIQLVNIIGSLFYGNVLGIFLLAFFVRYVKSNAVFLAAIITQVFILLLYYFAIYQFERIDEQPYFSFLWLNVIGCLVVMCIAIILQALTKNKNNETLDILTE